MPRFARLCLILVITGHAAGCAVFAVGSAAVSVASVGVKTATTVGGLAVDGAAATARAGASAMKSEPAPAKRQD